MRMVVCYVDNSNDFGTSTRLDYVILIIYSVAIWMVVSAGIVVCCMGWWYQRWLVLCGGRYRGLQYEPLLSVCSGILGDDVSTRTNRALRVLPSLLPHPLSLFKVLMTSACTFWSLRPTRLEIDLKLQTTGSLTSSLCSSAQLKASERERDILSIRVRSRFRKPFHKGFLTSALWGYSEGYDLAIVIRSMLAIRSESSDMTNPKRTVHAIIYRIWYRW